MEQKIEKIIQIKSLLMIELEKAEILLKICQDETTTEELEKTDINIISRMIHNIILLCAKMTDDIEEVILQK